MKHRIFFEADKDKGGQAAGQKDDGQVDIKSMAEQIKELKAALEGLKPKVPEDKSLNEKVEADRKEKEKSQADQKTLESAITFTVKSGDWLKEHKEILPKEVEEIFQMADKEKYDSPIQKANAVKAGIIQSFFSVQANVDNLTESQKRTLEDYLKLTKNGREERAHQVFENIFEPAMAMTKQVKKAEEITRAKNGFGNESDNEKKYVEKLVKLSRSHYLGEK